MSRIAASFFAKSPVMAAPLFAMGIFLVTFVGVLVWVWLKKPSSYTSVANLALDDSELHRPGSLTHAEATSQHSKN